MKFFFWIIAIPLALAIIIFAVNNGAMVDLDTWPLPYTPQVPVFAIGLIGLFIGFLFGGIVAWLRAGKTRRRSRDLYRRVESDQRDKAILAQKIKKMEDAERRASIPPAPTSTSMTTTAA
ncbi:MAG: DUF1049 domain-containing protein [Rhodospirillales bacterium]|nr:DUF1049 domain-containing protein [Rhodospirillales bacterium]